MFFAPAVCFPKGRSSKRVFGWVVRPQMACILSLHCWAGGLHAGHGGVFRSGDGRGKDYSGCEGMPRCRTTAAHGAFAEDTATPLGALALPRNRGVFLYIFCMSWRTWVTNFAESMLRLGDFQCAMCMFSKVSHTNGSLSTALHP